eukprot:1252034-Rhodomonas_salina.4
MFPRSPSSAGGAIYRWVERRRGGLKRRRGGGGGMLGRPRHGTASCLLPFPVVPFRVAVMGRAEEVGVGGARATRAGEGG